MHLGWELLDLTQDPIEFEGDPVTFEERRPGGKVEVGVNAARRASLPLSLDDPVRDLVTPLDTLLRATLYGDGWSETLFQGKVVPEEAGTAEGNSLMVNAVDPLAQLNALLIRSASIISGTETWDVVKLGTSLLSPSDFGQSDILWGLINLVAGHGVRRGAKAKAPGIVMEYEPGGSIGEAVVALCELAGSIDFELVPVEASDGTICELVTHYPRQGSDKSASVRFVYGAEPESATAFAHNPSGEIVNRVIFVGTGGIAGSIRAGTIFEHAASIEQFGPYEEAVDLEQISAAGLKAWVESGKQLIEAKAFPIDYFSFTPAPELIDGGDPEGSGVPPIFGPGADADYWLGDTIAVEAHRPGDLAPLELEGRITDAALVESAVGQLSVTLDCAPEPASGGITTRPFALRIPNQDGEVE